MVSRSSLAIILLMVLAACTGTESPAPQRIARADRFLASYARLDSSGRAAGADSLMAPLTSLARVYGYDTPDPMVLEWLGTSDMVATFQPDVDAAYPDLSGLEDTLGVIIANARAQALGLPEMSYASVVWGKPQPVLRDSAVVLVALNHFLGADYPGYSHLEPYRRTFKTRAALPYTLARVLVCTQHPMQPDDDTTLLAWMLYEGAATEAVMRMVPGADPAMALELTTEQYEYAEQNTRRLYNDLAASQAMFDKSPIVIDRYIAAAPSTPLLGGQAPGRAGRYLGYKIVRSYLDSHPGTPLDSLLSPTFYASRSTLVDSGF